MDILGITLEKAVCELKRRGISIEDIKYTKPFKHNVDYSREIVVRVDKVDENKVNLIVALFPQLKQKGL